MRYSGIIYLHVTNFYNIIKLISHDWVDYMSGFYYIVKFEKRDEYYHLNINLEYQNYLIPIFYRSFKNDKNEKSKIFKQIFNYFNQTHIKMTKNESQLLYNVFKHNDFILPNPQNFTELSSTFRMAKGLTPKEILFLIYINNKSVKSKIARYWETEYDLDVEYTIKHLIYLNYLTTENYRYNLERATKRELNVILEEYNLPITGKKSELVQLIKKHVPIDKQKEYFSGLYYTQTIKGEQIVLNHNCLNEFHKSYYRYAHQLKIEEFYLLSKRYKDLDAKDVCKMMVDSKSDETKTNFSWEVFEDAVKKPEVKEFEEIINKSNNKDLESEQKTISDDLFFSIINKTEKKIENNKELDMFYRIINKVPESTNIEVINDNQEIVEEVEEIEEVKEVEEVVLVKKKRRPKLLFTFVKSFIYSSVLCIIVIYIIFQYIIE